MLLGFVPYLEQPLVEVGPITIAAFGVIVAFSVIVGMALGARRFAELELDTVLGERFAWWVVIGGFIGAHLFAVIFYFPHAIVESPLILLRFWEHISSFGGIVGGAIAIAIFMARHGSSLDASTRWAYVDTAAYVFPISLMIGRIACALAHDHPGTITDFPLAISLAEPDAQAFISGTYAAAGRSAELPAPDVLRRLGFHDLGWYEFLFLAFVVVPVVLVRERRARRERVYRAGRTLVTFIVCYMPVRFALDFLRVSDVRYAGLTPAQWTALVAIALLPVLIAHIRRVPTRAFAWGRTGAGT
jgi:phosphatidylglycerol---prolipoprotein diacylglyceryl transferase